MEKLSEELKKIEYSFSFVESREQNEEARYTNLNLKDAKKCLDSFKQILAKIMAKKEKLFEEMGELLPELKDKYSQFFTNEEILSSPDYLDKKADTKKQIYEFYLLEMRTRKNIQKCEQIISRIQQELPRIKQEQHERRVKERKQEILGSKETELKYGIISIRQFYVDYNMGAYTKYGETGYSMAGSQHEWELSKKYQVPFYIKEQIDILDDAGKNCLSEFWIPTQSDSLSYHQEIRERQSKMEALKKMVEESPEEYSLPGQIVVDGMEIPITKRELIEANLFPSEFGWKSLEQVKAEEKKQQCIVTAKSIVHATAGLPKRAIDSARSIFSREKDERKDGRGE